MVEVFAQIVVMVLHMNSEQFWLDQCFADLIGTVVFQCDVIKSLLDLDIDDLNFKRNLN